MNRTLITVNPEAFPSQLRPLLVSAPVYDSSCSPEARVHFIDKDGGYFLKSASRGTLKTEAEMTAFFHSNQLGAQVLSYFTEGENDWLLTRRVPGEDCTHAQYLDDPKRLSETTAQLLRALHELNPAGCPVPQRTKDYLHTVETNYHCGHYDQSLFPDNWGYASAQDAIAAAREAAPHFKQDVLLHGDYCLPNVILDDWKFSGVIDVGNGGVGDRHIDLFWGIWTLQFNLKTDRYTDNFLDAYGRDKVDPALLRAVAACEVFG